MTTHHLPFVAVYADVTSGSSQASTACLQDVSYFNNHKTLQLAFTLFVTHANLLANKLRCSALLDNSNSTVVKGPF